ncbi:sensor histidine kinase [Desulfococcaceae bacterium HSG7]|nr:sensor histidine kinase [Desulfococcaceae bacterium HSG7]
MIIIDKLKPKFWDHHDVASGPYKSLFNFRRKWKLVILLTSSVTLIPLLFMTWLEYKITLRAARSEIRIQTSRSVSETYQAVSYFLSGHKLAIDFILEDNTYEDLQNKKRLASIFQSLRKGDAGDFIDIGIIDAQGRQKSYVGPYNLENADYCNKKCFREVTKRGMYISDLAIGSRHLKHLVMAVKHNLPDGSFFIIMATLDAKRINKLLPQPEFNKGSDAFIVNKNGQLQTQSRFYGDVLTQLPLSIPPFSDKVKVFETADKQGTELFAGYVYIPATPFILMIVSQKEKLMEPWHNVRLRFFVFLAASIIIILCVIIGMATYLVNKIYTADQKRIVALHEVEYSDKLASIGRLASGVAHEINNPLAIINEKAGFMKDMFTLQQIYEQDPKLIGLADSIMASVKRCRDITRRLLNFARHMEINVEIVNLRDVINEIIAFLKKEAERRSIEIVIDIPDDLPQLESDQGNLHQIFLNIINNAFAALSDGGRLEIGVSHETDDFVIVTFKDTGYGIPQEDLKRIFEPFFTTKFGQGGTGLGLSITYGLVEEMGGKISVTSQLNEGSCFNIQLPLKTENKKMQNSE